MSALRGKIPPQPTGSGIPSDVSLATLGLRLADLIRRSWEEGNEERDACDGDELQPGLRSLSTKWDRRRFATADFPADPPRGFFGGGCFFLNSTDRDGSGSEPILCSRY